LQEDPAFYGNYQLEPHIPNTYKKSVIDNGIIQKVHNKKIQKKLSTNTIKIASGELLSTLCDGKFLLANITQANFLTLFSFFPSLQITSSLSMIP